MKDIKSCVLARQIIVRIPTTCAFCKKHMFLQLLIHKLAVEFGPRHTDQIDCVQKKDTIE